MVSLIIDENSTKANIEPWFIPFDIFMIACNAVSVILAAMILILIIHDRNCRTVPMILVGNSCFAALIFASAMINVTSLTLYKDLKQIHHHDLFCVFAAYLSHVGCAAQNYSFLLQAIYRYLLITHPTRFFWHSYRNQILLICILWIIAFTYPLKYLLNNEIVYDVNNQVCELLPKLSISVIYMTLVVFGIPISMIVLIYITLVRYVKKMNTYITPRNRLLRARQHLKMVRRTFILVTIIVMVCFPYQLFLIMSFFNRAPKYNFRIAFIFGDLSILCVIIALFLFTDRLKTSLTKIIVKWQTTDTSVMS